MTIPGRETCEVVVFRSAAGASGITFAFMAYLNGYREGMLDVEPTEDAPDEHGALRYSAGDRLLIPLSNIDHVKVYE